MDENNTSAQNATPLCSACKSITFVQLRDGYAHPMEYASIVLSGKKCPLCRLIVCTMSRFQTENNCYETDEKYNVIAEELPALPAILRIDVPGFPPVEQMYLPSRIDWSRERYRGEPGLSSEVRKGNFNDGETIQVTASEESLYKIRNMVPLKSIEPASSPRNYRMIRKWLESCESRHTECLQCLTESSGRLNPPTRVIDVGSSEDFSARPRLVDTYGTSVRYVALSHRWAQTKTLKTTSNNFRSHQVRLPEKGITPTFRDAIEVTRQLGIRYLWIDSLCIIQDDVEEWKRESRIMGDIFAGACVTIAAVDSVDENGIDRGMLLPRPDPLEVTISLPFNRKPLSVLSQKVFGVDGGVYVWRYLWLSTRDSRHESIQEQNTITLRPRITSLHQKVRRSKWYNRGWILQERLLAPRMIYFLREKMYWDCFSATHDEEGGDPEVAIRSSLYSTRPVCASQRWQGIISEYVDCRLSFNTDRLVAIEGISQIFATYSSLKIHAGMAEDDACLLWYTKHKHLQRFSDFHAPSWTWASLDGVTSFHMPPPREATSESLVQDLRFDVKATCDTSSVNDRCQGTCVSGQVHFTSPVGKIHRSTLLKDVRCQGAPDDPVSKDVLRLLLGSAIVHEGFPIPRYDLNGNLMPMPPQSFVPDHTELLIDTHGACVGFFIPDMERESDGDINLLCASIKVWRVPQDICRENDTIEVIGLQAADQSNDCFHRVGRGRIMCNAWLPTCERRHIVII